MGATRPRSLWRSKQVQKVQYQEGSVDFVLESVPGAEVHPEETDQRRIRNEIQSLSLNCPKTDLDLLYIFLFLV